MFWRNRHCSGALGTFVFQIISVGLGFCSVLCLVLTYYSFLGLSHRLALVFQLGSRYLEFRRDANSLAHWLLAPFLVLAVSNGFVLMYAVLGVSQTIAVLVRRTLNAYRDSDIVALALLVWLLLSFGEAMSTRSSFVHYFLLVLPPLCLFSARFISRMFLDLAGQESGGSSIVLSVAVVLVLVASAYQNLDYYRYYTLYALGKADLQTFIQEGWKSQGSSMLRVQSIADYISAHTDPEDSVYYWSGDVQLYYLADRRCAIDLIWPIYAEATGSYDRIFAPTTRYVIVGESNNVPVAPWLYPMLEQNYELETVIMGQEVYVRAN